MKKIGIMGGTFDPIHIGHLILAESAKEQHHLDEIWVMPNGNPKYKSDREITDAHHRTAMVKLSIEDNPHLLLSTIEVEREGYTYTYETLKELKEEYPEYEFYFIIGADSLFALEHWKCPEKICKDCILLAANRNQATPEELKEAMTDLQTKFNADIRFIELPCIEISSNMIRSKLKNKETIRYYVTDKVLDYIVENKLYLQKEEKEEQHG